jgi:hypothetical protein
MMFLSNDKGLLAPKIVRKSERREIVCTYVGM